MQRLAPLSDIFAQAALWWTADRGLTAITALIAAVAIAAFWLIVHRKIQRQTAILRKQVHLETALEERYRDLVENATDLVFTVDMQGVVLGANKAAREIFGACSGDGTQQRLQDFIAPEDRKAIGDVFALLIGGEKTMLRQVHMAPEEGPHFVVEFNCCIRHVDGTPRYVEIIGRDVTRQTMEQTALEQARASAEAASRAKSEFLTNMSHEIRTPMNGILGMIELTLQGALEPDQRANLQIVRASAEALVTIINDVLDFSNTEMGRLELEHTPFEILPLVESCLDVITPEAFRKGVEVVCDLDPSLPREWIGDGPRLQRVLLSLAGNAAKFTNKGQIVIRVDRKHTVDGRVAAHFSVQDTGIGVPREHQQRIFEMFSQADGSSSRRYGGTGLGLAIASRLVARMGGRLSVESTPHVGSRFQFTIPVDSADEERAIVANGLAGRTAQIRVRNAVAASALVRLLSAAGAILVEDEAAWLVITDESFERRDSSAVIYLARPGEASAAYPDGATVVRMPATPRKLLAALRAIAESAASPPLTMYQRERTACQPGNGQSSTTAITILLAEDNKVNQILAVRTLEKDGYRVLVANNGREAVDLVRSRCPDLVLMDIQMPEMDGFEATDEIRRWSAVPVIAMTAHALKGDRERCLRRGMTDYISKPVRPAELLRVVEQYVTIAETAT